MNFDLLFLENYATLRANIWNFYLHIIVLLHIQKSPKLEMLRSKIVIFGVDLVCQINTGKWNVSCTIKNGYAAQNRLRTTDVDLYPKLAPLNSDAA